MTNLIVNDHELANFLDTNKRDQFASWQRSRTKAELINFIERRFAHLEDA